MRIGVPKEIKSDEYRVGMTPAGVAELAARGHQVVVEATAGAGSSFPDDDYLQQGAEIEMDAEALYRNTELIVKVKEPQPEELARLRPDHVLFAYLHLAADRALTEGLMQSGATCIAFETVTDASGALPLLAPMSEVAGRLATLSGAYMLQRPQGGRGVLVGGVPGVLPSKVLVIGGGVAGLNAARVAAGLGADVCVFDRNVDRLRYIDALYADTLHTAFASSLDIEDQLPEADLVIGAVLVSGGRAPHVITKRQLAAIRPHAVMVDISIDQGGCFETSRPTTHTAPTFEVDGVSHYCVANIPGAVPSTSTRALANVTLPFVLTLAEQGARQALAGNPRLRDGLNVAAGQVTYRHVADDLGLGYVSPQDALEM